MFFSAVSFYIISALSISLPQFCFQIWYSTHFSLAWQNFDNLGATVALGINSVFKEEVGYYRSMLRLKQAKFLPLNILPYDHIKFFLQVYFTPP